MDDCDGAFEGFGCVEGVISFKDVDERVLPLSYVIH
jgi:hypothetical protein